MQEVKVSKRILKRNNSDPYVLNKSKDKTIDQPDLQTNLETLNNLEFSLFNQLSKTLNDYTELYQKIIIHVKKVGSLNFGIEILSKSLTTQNSQIIAYMQDVYDSSNNTDGLSSSVANRTIYYGINTIKDDLKLLSELQTNIAILNKKYVNTLINTLNDETQKSLEYKNQLDLIFDNQTIRANQLNEISFIENDSTDLIGDEVYY